jgi:peptidase S46-like protein
VPPDATFSLRIADGVVTGYEYNGTIAPIFTTFYGIYDRHYSFPGKADWALPEKWQGPPAGLDLTTPMNFVSTADIIGGNSGSPVIDRSGAVIGAAFDGNIHSLAGNYGYDGSVNRTVVVSTDAIQEALEKIYPAPAVVAELKR